MKHLKKFEIVFHNDDINRISDTQKILLKKYKYKIGDKVKLIYPLENDTIFYINYIDIIENNENKNVYCLFDLANNFFGWVKESSIRPLTDIEISTYKYNI